MLPVKEITSTSGDSHQYFPTAFVFSRSAVTTLNTPSGKPASFAVWNHQTSTFVPENFDTAVIVHYLLQISLCTVKNKKEILLNKSLNITSVLRVHRKMFVACKMWCGPDYRMANYCYTMLCAYTIPNHNPPTCIQLKNLMKLNVSSTNFNAKMINSDVRSLKIWCTLISLSQVT